MKKRAPAAGGETACGRAIAHGELADAFVQELIDSLTSVDCPGKRIIRAQFAARLAALLSKVTNNNEEGPV